MICPSCQTLNFRDYKFCRECGGRLVVSHPPADLDLTRMASMAVHPQDSQIQSLLEGAFTAFDEGRLPDARGACESALALRPDSTAAHSLLGLICEREGKRAEAIHQFQVVLELNPDSLADREHLERLQRRKLPRRRPIAWRGSPLLAGSVAAAVVLFGGLWLVSGLLQPKPTTPQRVQPSNLRTMRGAPGAVQPYASGMRLPAPVNRSPLGPSYGATAAYPTNSGGSIGGVSPTVQMNSRMASLAPAILGAAGMGSTRPNLPVRPRTIAPAPVRPPSDFGVPLAGRPARYGTVPQLPDPRNAEPTTEPTSAPMQPENVAPAAPPVAPPTATREAPEETNGGSFIRIRPLSQEEMNRGDDSQRSRNEAESEQPSAAPATTPVRGPSIGEARLHQQNALSHWQKGDYLAAYQEYEYAAQLYRLIAARRGPDATAAEQGLRASYQGMQASRGRR